MTSPANNVAHTRATSGARQELQSQFQLFAAAWGLMSLATTYLRGAEAYVAGAFDGSFAVGHLVSHTTGTQRASLLSL